MRIKKKIFINLLDFTGLLYPINIYRGKKVSQKINAEDNCTYIVCSYGIGDIVWMLSFAKNYIDLHGIVSYKFVCLKRDAVLIHAYFPKAECVNVSRKEISLLGVYASVNKEKYISFMYPRIKSRKETLNELDLFSSLAIDMDVFYKYGCFDLDYNMPFLRPDLSFCEEEAYDIINKKCIPRLKSVLLIPDVHSRINLPRELWKDISHELFQMGYKVYTNTSDINEKGIDGTEPLYTSLETLPLIANHMGCVISGRCGLCDWLFVNECNLIVLHSYKLKTKTRQEKQMSSFGRKETLLGTKDRCGLNNKIFEVRVNTNGSINQYSEIFNYVKDIFGLK